MTPDALRRSDAGRLAQDIYAKIDEFAPGHPRYWQNFELVTAAIPPGIMHKIAALLHYHPGQTPISRAWLDGTDDTYRGAMAIFWLFGKHRGGGAGLIEYHHVQPTKCGGPHNLVVPLPVVVHVWAHAQLHAQIGGSALASALEFMTNVQNLPASRTISAAEWKDFLATYAPQVAKARADAAAAHSKFMMGNTYADGEHKCNNCGKVGHKSQNCPALDLPPDWQLLPGAGRRGDDPKVAEYFFPGRKSPDRTARYARIVAGRTVYAPSFKYIAQIDANLAAGGPGNSATRNGLDERGPCLAVASGRDAGDAASPPADASPPAAGPSRPVRPAAAAAAGGDKFIESDAASPPTAASPPPAAGPSRPVRPAAPAAAGDKREREYIELDDESDDEFIELDDESTREYTQPGLKRLFKGAREFLPPVPGDEFLPPPAPPGARQRQWVSSGLAREGEKVWRVLASDEACLKKGWVPTGIFRF